MDILLYALINSVVDKVDIPKLLRHLFWEIWKSVNVFELAYTGGTMADSELLGMVNVHGDLQKMKVV